MADPETIPPETKTRIDEIGATDLLIALPDAAALESATQKTYDALLTLSPDLRAVLVHSGGPHATPEGQNGRLRLLDLSWAAAPDSLLPAAASRRSHQALFTVARMLNVKACSVIGSDPQGIAPEHLARFLQPVLDQKYDFVAACYARHKFDSLINSGIVYPLVRALYGKRVQWPMTTDFALTRRLIERAISSTSRISMPARDASSAWLVTEAVSGGFGICQAHLRTRRESAQPGADLSTVLAQVIGPIFLDMERTAPFWQKIRGSLPVPIFGTPPPVAEAEESPDVDVTRMIESFQLGIRNLQEIWNVALTPATILGLKKLTRQAPDEFHMPDELWVRIIYDFALAHRDRVISRDHLLRALTPAYLAWVASYALEVKNAAPAEVEERIERLCRVYEAEKPYFQSRWRWPDRFNP